MPPLETFPLLSPAEFKTICHGFITLQQKLQSTSPSLKQHIWSLKEKKLPWGQDSITYLSLRKPAGNLPAGRPSEAKNEAEVASEAEDEAQSEPAAEPEDTLDPESLPPRGIISNASPGEVEYTIHYSPTFRVPVLWFSQPLQGVKVVEGKLSLGDHPLTGEIAWFVHPCRTREAMEVWSGTEVECVPEEGRYVAVWLELVAAAAGLG
ncbi:hypothetical protein BZA77DRAFT_369610 [Pyronema omphalodes]|nr:hypothetical protein BZA77DRAFT_369610 [Pyronema omphalodes]